MADTKLSALTEDTNPSSDDLVYIVDSPGGTPASKKATFANAGKALTAIPNATDITISGTFTDGTMSINGGNLTAVGSIGTTGARITKLWATDIESTNAIAGDITGNAATVTTITGLAPDTATTQATQPNITTCANLTTVGTIGTGVWQGTAIDGAYIDIEGTEIKSTGEAGGTKFLREDGDGTCSWQTVAAGGGTLDDAYDFGGAGAGKAITVDSGAVALSGGAALLDLTSTATTETVQKITVSSLTSGNGLWIYSNTSGDGGKLLFVENDTDGGDQACIWAQQDSDYFGIYLLANGCNTVGAFNIAGNGITTGNLGSFGSSSQNITTGNVLQVDHDAASISADFTSAVLQVNSERAMTAATTRSDDYDAGNIFREAQSNNAGATMNSSGSILKLSSASIETTGTLNHDAVGLEIDHNPFHANDIYAVKITCNNADTGGAGGIDMSSFSVDEPLLKVPADAITSAGTLSHQAAVDVGGTTYYINLYTTGT